MIDFPDDKHAHHDGGIEPNGASVNGVKRRLFVPRQPKSAGNYHGQGKNHGYGRYIFELFAHDSPHYNKKSPSWETFSFDLFAMERETRLWIHRLLVVLSRRSQFQTKLSALQQEF